MASNPSLMWGSKRIKTTQGEGGSSGGEIMCSFYAPVI